MTPADLAVLLGLPDLAAGLAAVEEALDRAIVVEAGEIESPARRVVLGGGKRLRPALAIACAAAATGGGDELGVDPPSWPEPPPSSWSRPARWSTTTSWTAGERRGVPTINAVEGPNQALLGR